MALENLKQNIAREKEIIREMLMLMDYADYGREKKLQETIDALADMLFAVNNSIPILADNISPIKKIGEAETVSGMISLKYESGDERKNVTITKEDQTRFFEGLRKSSGIIKKLKTEIKKTDFKKPSIYAKVSNKFFSKLSNNLVEKGKFNSLSLQLRKANMPFILNTYVSMTLFSSLIAFFAGILVFIMLLFYTPSINPPFFLQTQLSLNRILINILVSLAIPIMTFIAFWAYPSAEKQSIQKNIELELPFAAMHMSAIAGSGIEPSQIFKIIASGTEYPYTKQEIKKLINQVNIYGYDLVSALKNSAKATSSSKLSELFNGIAVTISSGGSLTDFLDKRTETLLFDYRLERERATKTAETFMDIYISVVIAAPMIMMLLLVLMNVSSISIGLSLNALTIVIVSIVALINLVFLVILQLKQPRY